MNHSKQKLGIFWLPLFIIEVECDSITNCENMAQAADGLQKSTELQTKACLLTPHNPNMHRKHW